MFVIRTGVVAATLGALTLGACTDPAQDTDLRPDGPPDVLAVMVMTDAATQLHESAVYCKPNDPKRPSLVGLPDFTTNQICPEDLSKGADPVDNAYPDGWYVRVMFDELLDPSIETLTPILDSDGKETGNFSGSIAASHPVTLLCESVNGGMVSVDYDGYYQPAGNRVTWPLGPSLVIKPNNPKAIATNTECTLTINTEVVRDKSGEKVPDAEKGPFKFRTAQIAAIAVDPPDDPEMAAPIDATQVYYDNFYIQFNTSVFAEGPSGIYNGLCDDVNGDGLCDDEKQISFKDVAHPDEGPGYCDDGAAGGSFTPCSTIADCPAGDTVCGRGYCDTTFGACNKASDCTDPSDTFCEPSYTYSYAPYGLTEAEFGAGPVNPIETEKSYIFSLSANAPLKDRCGKTTMITPSADANTIVHFTTNPFKFKKANIATGETASALKKLQLLFSNAIKGGDVPRTAVTTIDSTEFSLDPAPFQANATAGQPPVQITDPTKLLIVSPDGNGQVMLRGFFEMNKDYTFTLKAGATVEDFYGKVYTNASDLVIKWKTQPAIAISSISPADTSTVTKATPASSTNITFTFNQAMDPTTLDTSDFTIDPAVPGLTFGKGTSPTSSTSVRDCTENVNTCRLRITGVFQPGTYKLTLKQGAAFKDVFGNVYTQAADKVVTFTVKEAAAPIQCL